MDNSTPDKFYFEAIKTLKPKKIGIVGYRPLKIVPEERIESLVNVLRKRFGDLEISVGTDAFFAELNRYRLGTEVADTLVFSMNPQVHAFDNQSIIETLEGQAANVQTALDLTGGKAPWCSPVTLKMRWNPNATGEQSGSSEDSLPADVDIRQISPFCACWTLASIGRLSELVLRWQHITSCQVGKDFSSMMPPRSILVYFHQHHYKYSQYMMFSQFFTGLKVENCFSGKQTIF